MPENGLKIVDKGGTDMGAFHCGQISSERDMTHSRRIRRKVFVEEQHIPADMEFDEKDNISFHVLGYENTIPVATGRLVPEYQAGLKKGSLSRIAVLADYRKKGYGKQIVLRLEDIAKREGMTHLSLYPHFYLEDFYASLGYHTVAGKTASVAGHPLIYMEKDL